MYVCCKSEEVVLTITHVADESVEVALQLSLFTHSLSLHALLDLIINIPDRSDHRHQTKLKYHFTRFPDKRQHNETSKFPNKSHHEYEFTHFYQS